MLKKITILLFLFALCSAPLIQAKAADFGPIAVVNVKKILRESKATKNIQDQIEDNRKKLQASVNKEEDALKDKDQELAKQRTVLSPEAFEEKRKEFKKEVIEVQRDIQSKRVKLENAYAKALSEVQDVVMKIISEIAKEKGFSTAIPTSQVLFSEDRLDISDEVLKLLDSRLPKVKVTIE